MNRLKYKLKMIDKPELIKIKGGGIISATVGIAVLVLSGATALGYYDAKKNCMPPPCK